MPVHNYQVIVKWLQTHCWATANKYLKTAKATLHLKWKNLVTDSPEKLEHVLDTMNKN